MEFQMVVASSGLASRNSGLTSRMKGLTVVVLGF